MHARIVKILNRCRAALSKLLWVLLGCLAFSFPSLSTTRDDVLKMAEASGRTRLEETEMPETYRILNEFLALLTKSASTRIHSYVASSELIIVQDKTPNAHVYIAHSAGQSRVRIIICLTTNLLQTFLGQNLNPDDFRERLEEIAGVIAHELGHIPDKLTRGIEHYHGKQANQAVELRADNEAIQILRDSGLPLDSLKKANDRLVRSENMTFLENLGKTHPADLARGRFMELEIHERPQNIEPQISVPNFTLESIHRVKQEVQNLPKSFRQVMVWPTSLSEIKFKYLKFWEVDPTVFNAHVLWLDHKLSQGQINTADPDFLEIVNAISTISSRYRGLCTTKECLKKLFENLAGFAGVNLIPHREFVRTLPFYNKNKFIIHQASALNRAYKASDLGLYPMEHILNALQENLTQSRSDLTKLRTSLEILTSLLDASMSRGDSIDPQDFLDLTQFFHSQIQPLLNQLKNQRSALQTSQISFLVPTRISRDYWQNLLRRSQDRRLIERASEVIHQIWLNRGFWATLEFMESQNSPLDWDFIGQHVGIPRDQIKNEVQREFKIFLRHQIQEDLQSKHDEIVHSSESGKDPWLVRSEVPTWFTSSMKKYLEQIFKELPDGHVKSIYSNSFNSILRYYNNLLTDDIESLFQSNNGDLESEKQNKEYLENLIKEQGSKLPISSWPLLYHHAKQSGLVGDVYAFDRLFPESIPQRPLSVLSEIWAQEIKETLILLPSDKTSILKGLELISKVIQHEHEVNQFPSAPTSAAIFIKALIPLTLTHWEKQNAFEYLTNFSVGPQTDEFFKTTLQSRYLEDKDWIKLRSFLKAKRFFDPQLSADLARHVLTDKINTEDLFVLSEDINSMLPEASKGKDAILESIAWQRNLSGPELQAHVEDEKSSNFPKLDPTNANAISSFSVLLRSATLKEKKELIEYILDSGQNRSLPDFITESLRQDLLLQTRILNLSEKNKRAQIDFFIEKMKKNYSQTTRTLTPAQKIVLLDLILSSGSKPMVSQSGFLTDLIIHSLGTEADSFENFLYRTFLESVPENQRSIFLAKLLLQRRDSPQTKSALSQIFESLGPVGFEIKNKAKAWNLFGSLKQTRLDATEERAGTLSKFEAETALRKILGDDRYSKEIKNLIQIVSTGNLKSLVLVETANGEHQSWILKNQKIEALFKNRLNIAKIFFKSWRTQSPETLSPVVNILIENLESQIQSGSDLRNEADKIGQLGQIANQLNKNRQNRGWILEVPKIQSEDLLQKEGFAAAAPDGISAQEFFKDPQISSREKESVSRWVTKTTLALIFKHGMLDTHPTLEHWFVDRQHQKITFIGADSLVRLPTQSSIFKSDPRLFMGQFLMALQDRNAERLLRTCLKMQNPESQARFDYGHAVNVLQRRLSQNISGSELRQKVLEDLVLLGLRLDSDIAFGIFNALQVLDQNRWIEKSEFDDILNSEISRLTWTKAPAVILDPVKLPQLKSQRKDLSSTQRTLTCPEVTAP